MKSVVYYPDNWAHEQMPPAELLPEVLSEYDQYASNSPLNAADVFLDRHLKEGRGGDVCLIAEGVKWTYADLHEKANRIAGVLVNEMGLVPGNRVLLRSANNPMLVATWFGVLKAGGIAVTTMPLLRAKELQVIVQEAQVSHALYDDRLGSEMEGWSEGVLRSKSFSGPLGGNGDLELSMQTQTGDFANHEPRADAIAIIGFTSGTTGIPKMTAHFHKDLVNICSCFPRYALQPNADDVFMGSPPLGFTFGLGGLVLFPFFVGAKTVLLEKPAPDLFLEAIERDQVTICFTAPTAWRVLAEKVGGYNIQSLRGCVSAGETLPARIWKDWKAATGLEIIDGIGATELLHIFISNAPGVMKVGTTGKPILGYEAKIVDDNGQELPTGTPGKLAVRGITGCKYLNREHKQREYVQKGWNITGDVFEKDEEGFYRFVARGDDMIVSSGYNIAAIEVESVLLEHPAVSGCAVIGVDDDARGKIVCAFVVLQSEYAASDDLILELQNWFKSQAAPYKYPRKIVFLSDLPKTQTGKIQRFKLKELIIYGE